MSGEEIAPEPVPVTRDQAGWLMVSGTRIPIDILVRAFNQGESAEAIHEENNAISLADVYAILSYYLRHRPEVDAYLDEREMLATGFPAHVEAGDSSAGLGDRLAEQRAASRAHALDEIAATADHLDTNDYTPTR